MSEKKFFMILVILVGANVTVGTITALYLETAPITMFNALVAPIVISIMAIFTYLIINITLKDLKLQPFHQSSRSELE